LYVELFDFDLCLVLIWGKVWTYVLSDWISFLTLKSFGIKNTKRKGAQLFKCT